MKPFWEGYITALSDASFSYTQIIKMCKNRGFAVSKGGISAVLKSQRNSPLSVNLNEPGPSRRRHAPSRTAEVVRKVKRLVTGENPKTQRSVAKAVKVSQSTVHNIIRKDLQLEKRHKSRVHKLLPRHIAERRTNCRKLYEGYLAADKWQFVVTLDEAYIYLSDCNKPRAIFYKPKGEKTFTKWYKECRETFSKGFMIIAGYCARGKLEIRKVAPKVKVNSAYYQAQVLDPIFRKEIPSLYGRDSQRVWLHQDKASSHTSRSTATHLATLEQETGIRSIPFTDIPVKSPDASPMDFCAFGLLKRALGSRRPRSLGGLWKACKEEWAAIDMNSLRLSLLQWKLRCRAIVHNQGHQIEHNRSWRRGLS